MEKWIFIKGYENLYQISTYGKIRRIYKNGNVKILKYDKSNGYSRVILCKNNIKNRYFVHRLVAYAFCLKSAQIFLAYCSTSAKYHLRDGI